MRFLPIFYLIALWLVVATASAHHSFRIFDQATVVTLEGMVVRYDWRNPHVYIYLEVLNEDGGTVEWALETHNPASLARLGWTPDLIETGDSITVSANPHRDQERHLGFVTTLVAPDGATLLASARPSALPDDSATDLSGVWQAELESSRAIYRRYLYESAAAPLTAKAQAALAEFDESQNPAANCRLVPAPWVMAILLDVYEVEIHEDHVILRDPEVGLERVVDMTSRVHEPTRERTDQGHSVGWWEDDVLIVDTAHFADHRWGNGRGIPSGVQRHLVERFRLNVDGTSLTYSFVLEDPEFLTEPIDGSITWQYAPSLRTQTSPLPCDPEVARRYLTEGEAE